MSGKLLIVEDEEDLLQMIEIMAKHQNFECVHDINGNKVVELAEAENPDLILLDLNLPMISGLGILRELKKRPHLKAIPVIIFSAIHETDVVREAIDLGANAYFTKGGHIKHLFELVREYMKPEAGTAQAPAAV